MLRRRVLPQAILSSAVALRCTSSSSDLAGHVRRYESERSERQQRSSTSSNNTSTAGSAWLARLQRESVSEHDPLQGRYHPDYFRDPARGYEPMFAPRNYAEGGAVAHQHHLSDETYVQSFRDREQLRHEHELNRREARGNRQLLRDGAAQQEAANPVTGSTSSSTSVVDMFRNAMVEPTTSHYLGSFQSAAAASSQQQSLQLGHERATFLQGQVQKQSERYDNMLDEGLRTAHGLRELERHEFDVKQRMEHIPFRGYDMDRYLSINKAHGSNPFNTLGNVVAPGSAAEAQANVRRNSVSERDAQITRAWSENTVRADPRIGESLTEEIVSTLHSSKNTKSQTHEQARNERFGIGRQRPLVHDGGPDSRTIQRHKNDERLLRALTFREHAYRKGMNDEHADPFHRNNVDNGVGHLLRTKFDVDRRAANFAAGKADVTERATQYLGKQVQQEIDEFVLRRRNARGERPLEYFRPFPTYRDMRLQKAYRDVEGFPLMRSRPEFLEWELFTRYRAHFEQRRLLALKHGLEPRPNETVQERDARREKLDAICENTPFDASLLTVALDEQVTDAAALRAWFGHYLLPSPTIVKSVTSNDALGLFVNAQMDPLGTEDKREHVLSSRYFNTLFLNEAYRYRIGRGNVKDLIGSMPEISAAHQQPPSVLKHFSKHERAVYDAYMASETQKQSQQWTMQTSGKRWIAHKRQFGVRDGNKERSVDVMDVERVSDGSLITIAAEEYAEPIRKALADSSKAITIDNEECRLLEHSRRNTRIFEVKLDDGSILPMEESEFSACETEAQHQQQTNQPTMDVNHAVNAGLGVTYHYNRSNYIETQDAIWEERCANRSEGWSSATHADGLRVGLPVMARRLLSASSPGGARGGLQRGVITQYLRQPFFNPEPRTVSVAFGAQGGSEATGEVEHVPLDQVHIWQRQYYGPERTAGEATRKLNASSRRYVNVADPNKERVQQQQSATEPHFLEKYKVHSAASIAEGLQSVKEIAEIDTWTANFDTPRSDNYRPLTINHRKDYVKGKYFHRYTPWDWIMTQEADQPLIWSQLRTDDIGPSYHHSVNRYWRYKARPHGYVRNFENEVRDLFQYVDGVTPWEKAKKLRTYWEVREHHPIPQFNRPEVAIHRNHMGLLPSQLWDTDKKTGRVKSVKDSVRDYQTTSEIPLWGR